MGSDTPHGSSQQAIKHGITKPISLSGPSDADLHRNLQLERVILFSFIFFYFLIFRNSEIDFYGVLVFG